MTKLSRTDVIDPLVLNITLDVEKCIKNWRDTACCINKRAVTGIAIVCQDCNFFAL